MVRFSKMVKELRTSLGLTQDKFAQQLNVSFSTINRWENEKSEPPYKMRLKISKMCDEQGIKPSE